MSPPPSNCSTADNGMRQMVRRPRESDGVGNALRQIFSNHSTLPADIGKLLSRLNQND